MGTVHWIGLQVFYTNPLLQETFSLKILNCVGQLGL